MTTTTQNNQPANADNTTKPEILQEEPPLLGQCKENIEETVQKVLL
jgi:hypothetical protein